MAITSKQRAARDVAALGARVLHQHATLAQALEALLATLPVLLEHLEAASAAVPAAGKDISGGQVRG